MSEELVKEPSRFQLCVYCFLSLVIKGLGKLRMRVISPDGKYIKQYDEGVDESVEILEANCGWAAQVTCEVCQQRHILFKSNEHYEIIAVWPEYALPDGDMGEEKGG